MLRNQQALRALIQQRVLCHIGGQSLRRSSQWQTWSRDGFRILRASERTTVFAATAYADSGVRQRAERQAGADVWVDTRPDTFADVVEANPTALQLTFLGTAADDGRHGRRRFSLAVRTPRSCLLFDCCEDTQRALLHAPHVRPSRITRIFISCLDGDQVCGLPGMLCTVSAAREKGHDMADVPLHLYGPRGIAQYVDAMLRVSDTYLLMPVVIHEFTVQPPDIAGWEPDQLEQWEPELVQINRRARLFACMLPPDQLNAAGYYDGSQTTMLSRRARDGGRVRGGDTRAGTLPLPLPPPGNPAATDVRLPDMTWTIRSNDEYLVTASALPHEGAPCIAYTLLEADRSGVLDPAKAVALGVKPGKAFALLKAGHAVETADGRTVEACEVVGPSRTGRRLLVLGESQQPAAPAIAHGCNIVVVPASYKGKSMASTAGAAASQLGAKQLILTRHADRPDAALWPGATAESDMAAAQTMFQGGKVVSAVDLGVMNLPRPDPAGQQ